MLKKYFLITESGARVFVGYKVKNLDHLNELGYHVSPLTVEYYTKARRKGVVYISKTGYGKATEVDLFDNKGMLIGTAYKNKEGVKNDQRKIGNTNF